MSDHSDALTTEERDRVEWERREQMWAEEDERERLRRES